MCPACCFLNNGRCVSFCFCKLCAECAKCHVLSSCVRDQQRQSTSAAWPSQKVATLISTVTSLFPRSHVLPFKFLCLFQKLSTCKLTDGNGAFLLFDLSLICGSGPWQHIKQLCARTTSSPFPTITWVFCWPKWQSMTRSGCLPFLNSCLTIQCSP